MFKKLFTNLSAFNEENSFVCKVSYEITNLRMECKDVIIHKADQKLFAIATKTLTNTIAQRGLTPELKSAPPRTVAWSLINEMIFQIGVGDNPSLDVSEKFYRFFENEKLKEIESIYGPISSW